MPVDGTFAHSAFRYTSTADYLALLEPFICEGLAAGETVAVATGPEHTARLRAALGADAERVRFLDAADWYVRPVRTIAAWVHLLRAARGPARLVNEVPAGLSGALEWVRFESALNASLAGFEVQVLCPYGQSATARTTHHRIHDDGWQHSESYRPPEDLLVALPAQPHPVSGPPVLDLPIGDAVVDLRTHVRDRATAERWLTPDDVETLLLAVTEISTNAIRHGGPDRRLRVWRTGDEVVGEVTDDGRTPPGPLVGYLPPTPGSVGKMGLWIVAQVCDALTVRSSGGVTHVRFALR